MQEENLNAMVAQVAITIANGYVLFTMAYDEFVKNAKSEFIKEDKNNAD